MRDRSYEFQWGKINGKAGNWETREVVYYGGRCKETTVVRWKTSCVNYARG